MSTELDELLAPKPETPPQETPPPDEDKVGKLANENAELRRRLDTLQSEMEAFRKPATPEPPRDDPDKWYADYLAQVEREEHITDQDALTDPLGTMRRYNKRILKDSRGWVENIAIQKGQEAAAGVNLSIRMSQRHPRIWNTRIGQQGIQEAIGDLIRDSRFQRLISRPETLNDALDVVAKRVEKIIPELATTSRRVRGDDDEIPEIPREPKGTQALSSGARPQGPRFVDEDVQERAGRDMDDFLSAQRSGKQRTK